MKTLPILALFFTAASARSADQAAATGTNQPAVSITNWQRVDLTSRGFDGLRQLSFSIPPGMTNVPSRGIDSMVGRYASENTRLEFDFGRYASGLGDASHYVELADLQVGGHAAKMAIRLLKLNELPLQQTGGATNLVVLSVPNVTGEGRNGNSLRMQIFYRDPKDLPVVRAIIDSIKF